MRSHRGSWLGRCLMAVAFLAMPVACTSVRAQPGFGPDPFWPYNNQYTPYLTPMGPADPAGGGRGIMESQRGLRGANQFQQYIEGLQGSSPGRNTTDRAGIGMPYYRSSVDPLYDTRGARQYRPNANSTQNFERAQQRVADRYFAYYAQRDPAKRAELLREYRAARRDAERAAAGRSASTPRGLGASSGLERGSGRSAQAGSAAGRADAADRTTGRPGRFGPAPEIPGVGSTRPSGSTPRRTTPTDVLNRSRAMDGGGGILPGSSAPYSARPRGPRPAVGADSARVPGSSSSIRSRARRPDAATSAFGTGGDGDR